MIACHCLIQEEAGGFAGALDVARRAAEGQDGLHCRLIAEPLKVRQSSVSLRHQMLSYRPLCAFSISAEQAK